MKILIAEDDLVSRHVLEKMLRTWGHQPLVTCDGDSAWQALQHPGAVEVALLDWMMPDVDGIELCRRIRATPVLASLYVILVTARTAKDDVIAGLESGADDYLTKPFDRDELRARLLVGRRIIDMQHRMADQLRQLQETLGQVKHLQGLLPICCYCKKIRADNNYWQQVETYFTARSETRFSHAICPTCWEQQVEPQLVRASATGCRAAPEPEVEPTVNAGHAAHAKREPRPQSTSEKLC